jgi:hypothetical protein
MRLIRSAAPRRVLRRLAFAIVPLAAAGALIGPAAGTAYAMRPAPSSCPALLSSADDNWDTATEFDLGADAALARGDLMTWAEDNTLANTYADKGDENWDLYVSQGC